MDLNLRAGELILALGLGSNLPPRARGVFDVDALEPRLRALEGALRLLDDAGLRVRATSSVHESAPQGVPTPQPDYLNACALISCNGLSLTRVLEICRAIEGEAGREGKGDLAARPLDLDLLCGWVSERTGELSALPPRSGRELTLPHPRLHTRAFVLVPLAELAGDLLIDIAPRPSSPRQLLERLSESSEREQMQLQTVSAPSFPHSWADGQC